MSILIGRYVNGISLNGLEFALKHDGNCYEFNSVEDAKRWLIDEAGVPSEVVNHPDCDFHYKDTETGEIL